MWQFVDSNPFWTSLAITSQHHQTIKLISLILFCSGRIKVSICHFTEKRFTKLGYSAASILNALPYLRMFLSEIHFWNQHVEIVRMFLSSEFFMTELTALAYFIHCISLPLLNFVEVNPQDKLLDMFPKLFQDLRNGKMDTLSNYLFVYMYVSIEPPTSETDDLLL